MTTISAPSNRHLPVMPLPMPSYAYRYPNSDSEPFSSLPDRCGIYNREFPSTYKWENHFPEQNVKSTYLGPDWFKEPPKHYALSPNFPKENYSPKYTNNDKPIAAISAKGYVPHYTNKTHQAWKKFLNETPERYNLSHSADNNRRTIVDFGGNSSFPPIRSGTLDSGETAITGIGADFTQRPWMALNSQYRNNDGYRHASLMNLNNWKPYGNAPAYFNNYIMGAPKFS